MEVFCKRLREQRKEKQFTQQRLAAIIGTNNSSICDWECGRSQPSLEALAKLATIFGVSTDYLLGLEREDGVKTYSPL